MSMSLVRTIFVKELREVLRDRRTLLLMIGIPVFLYPALFVLMEQVALFGRDEIQQIVPRVAVAGAIDDRAAEAVLPPDATVQRVPLPADPETALRAGTIDAVLVLDPGQSATMSARAEILFDGSRETSLRAHALLEDHLDTESGEILRARLDSAGLPQGFVEPIVVEVTSVATAKGMGGAALGRFLPMILILMTVLGAFHPAIDVAAGERERKTLEPLLTTPAPSGVIVTGKFLAVALIAFTAAALNLASMLLTLDAGIFQFAESIGLEFSLPATAILFILGLLLLLALLFSALFMGIAVGAQSFREAQTALTPVYLISFLPAIVTSAPGIAFTPAIALVPVAGVAMLFRALMAGEPVGIEGVVAVGATLAYVALAIAYAAHRFGREDVLFGGGGSEASTSWRSSLQRWREARVDRPSPAAALLFVCGVGLLFFYIGLRFQVWGERGIFASQWLLLGLPAIAFALFGPYRIRSTLAFRRAPMRAYAAAVLIILGAIPTGWMVAWLQSAFFELPEEFLKMMQGLLTADTPGRLAWLVLLIALTPAICEELVFRGVLLQGLARDLSRWQAVLASAVVFGAFHLSFETAIRFLPTMLTGVLLAHVALRTGSIGPGMVMHFLNNATVVLFLSMPELQAVAITPEGGPNWVLLAIGVLLLAAGLRLLPDVDAQRVEEQRGRRPAAEPILIRSAPETP